MKRVFFLFSVIFSQTVLAQEDFVDNKPESALSISSIWLETGFNLFSNAPVHLADFRRAVPESEILAADYSDFKSSGPLGLGASPVFFVHTGWQPGRSKAGNRPPFFELRTGLGFGRLSGWMLQMNRNETLSTDTLVSNLSGEIFVLDSVRRHSLSALRNSGFVHLDFAAIWRTNPEKELQGHLGLGLMGSFAYLSRIDINRTIESYAELQSDSNTGRQIGASKIEAETESFSVQNPISYTFYIPVGVSYCLNRRAEEIQKKWHICVEFRQGFTQVNYPETQTQGSVYTAFNWALRYKL